MYIDEVTELVMTLNKVKPESWKALTVPDARFHRAIGDFSGERFSVTGEKLDSAAHAKHLTEELPSESDKQYLRDLMKEDGWLAPPPKETLF